MAIKESQRITMVKLNSTIHKRSDFIYYHARVTFNDWLHIRGSWEEEAAYIIRAMSLKNEKNLDNK